MCLQCAAGATSAAGSMSALGPMALGLLGAAVLPLRRTLGHLLRRVRFPQVRAILPGVLAPVLVFSGMALPVAMPLQAPVRNAPIEPNLVLSR